MKKLLVCCLFVFGIVFLSSGIICAEENVAKSLKSISQESIDKSIKYKYRFWNLVVVVFAKAVEPEKGYCGSVKIAYINKKEEEIKKTMIVCLSGAEKVQEDFFKPRDGIRKVFLTPAHYEDKDLEFVDQRHFKWVGTLDAEGNFQERPYEWKK